MSLEKAEQALEIFQKRYNSQVIFYGPPGTSKTYTSTILAANTLKMRWNSRTAERETQPDHLTDPKTAYQEAQDYLSNEKERYALVQFHPSYTMRISFVGLKWIQIEIIKSLTKW